MATSKFTLNEITNLIKEIIKEETNLELVEKARSFFDAFKNYNTTSANDTRRKVEFRSIIDSLMKDPKYVFKTEKKQFSEVVLFYVKNVNSDEFILFGEKKPIYGKNHNILKYNYKFLL